MPAFGTQSVELAGLDSFLLWASLPRASLLSCISCCALSCVDVAEDGESQVFAGGVCISSKAKSSGCGAWSYLGNGSLGMAHRLPLMGFALSSLIPLLFLAGDAGVLGGGAADLLFCHSTLCVHGTDGQQVPLSWAHKGGLSPELLAPCAPTLILGLPGTAQGRAVLV